MYASEDVRMSDPMVIEWVNTAICWARWPRGLNEDGGDGHGFWAATASVLYRSMRRHLDQDLDWTGPVCIRPRPGRRWLECGAGTCWWCIGGYLQAARIFVDGSGEAARPEMDALRLRLESRTVLRTPKWPRPMRRGAGSQFGAGL